MCGIYGSTIFYKDNIVKKKLERISFRGPDFSAFKRFGSVILGQNRLAILDLDSRSNQPLLYEHLVIVYNGEVYNFKKIKARLIQKGYQFSTTSDTEVICAAYLEYGENCVNEFNGMFAFVIFDKKKNILFGARDRLGQKPFYYYISDRGFEFASQLSSIAISNSFIVNDKAISQFLLWKYIPEPNSIYSEVKKLKAGYSFIYDLSSKKITKKQYWDLPNNYNSFKGSYFEAQMELEHLLGNAVEQRLVSDVPLGVFLSGGIDSSLIAAMAQERSTNPINTFAIKFSDKGFDESPFAEKAAKIIGSNHLTIEATHAEGIDLIENYNYYFDEPFSDASAIPSMLLAKHTKKHVSVALSGDGGDENFLGYHSYTSLLNAQKVYRIPFSLRKMLSATKRFSSNRRMQQMTKAVAYENIEQFHYSFMRKIDSSLLLNEDDADSDDYLYVYDSNKPILEKASDFDFKMFVSGDSNTKVDRATMAFSLEARAPFFDYRVVEFSRSLPTSYKYKNGNKKRILKDILHKHISEKEFLNRPKSGFTMPFELWFREGLKELVLDTLTHSNLKDIPNLNLKEVDKILQEHIFKRTYNHYPKIWSLLVLVKFLKNV